MKKILMAEYLEYDSNFKVGNHHYAKLFAQNGYEILWLSPVYNQLYYFKDKNLYKQRRSLHTSPFVKLEDNIFGYAPYSPVLYGKMPILDSKLASKLSIEWTVPNIFSALKGNGFNDIDILWLTNPKYYYLLNKVKYKKLFYRCADDITAFRDSCKTFEYFEEKIIQRADEVFVTAHSLIEKKQHLRNDLIYLPNGVGLDNFVRDKYDIPREYRNNRRKKCIYVGAIDRWFDSKLLLYCAEKLSNIDFYLIGPLKIDLSILQNHKNIYILGKKNYNEVPDYLYYSDVSIIPFDVSTLTNSIAPIKLYEYMSVGLNVVSTNFKEMQYIDSPAFVAKDYNQFCNYIIRAIESEDKNRKENINFAKQNTWEERFKAIESYLK